MFLVSQAPTTSTPLKSSMNYEFKQESPQDNNDNQKATRFLGNNAVAILQNWFQENKDYPYPDDATTEKLAQQASKLNN
jgi:hypothetical protein